MSAFTLKIVTPTEIYFEGPVASVIAPGEEGYFGVLNSHAPLVTTVGKGKLIYRSEDGAERTLQVEGGFLEVLKNRVLLLTDKLSVA